MTIKNIGTRAENIIINKFRDMGYFVQFIKGMAQPVDLICVKNNIAYFIEVKHCKNSRFVLNRIENNQINSFNYNKKCGNTNYYLVIVCDELNSIFLLNFADINFEQPSINLKELTAKWKLQ